MKSICYIVPFFGQLPKNFQLWLNTCKYNSTINWIIFTNDKSEYSYPENVKVNYCTFEDIKNKIQSCFDFKVNIETYWRLSYFKPAYGEIFQDYIKQYDFWGHCDVDLLWGNIREFITNDLLERYEKIGFQGHSTIYKNTDEVNSRYKVIVPNKNNYIDEFTGKTNSCFDEIGVENIYKYLKIPYYKKVDFAHLSKYDYSFYLKYLDKEYDYKNKHQVFIWQNGKLTRYYLDKDKKVCQEDYMYIHFFCRPIKYEAKNIDTSARYLIYPDKVIDYDGVIDKKIIQKKGSCTMIKYYASSIIYNRKKLTLKKILGNIARMFNYKMSKK